ncbi:hypothetical protein LX99_04778 [Mucilaginibacter oryzae]|uniref:EcsC family protein n=1 Tax=Mucilaginibacter oryzae TaxID=468058 RepID=A0A316GXL6_9SPHI|nr:hypothetical protein [Mucilaginibacter oryzae]PWK69279.1 hypothetical protein LX99_04778 [Mucilaginibacter oryzae]
MKLIKLNKIGSDLRLHTENLAHVGFRKIFDGIDQLKIKKGVDKLGIDGFINQCACLAAGSGAMAGSGGMFTLVAGIPFDFINLITQQFRAIMGIMYYYRGTYENGFEDFMALVATSVKVEAGVAITRSMMEGIAERMLMILGTRTAERLVPVVGAVIGGTANYLFIKRIAARVKEMQKEFVVIAIE